MSKRATVRKDAIVRAARVLLSDPKTYAGRQRIACVWSGIFFRLRLLFLLLFERSAAHCMRLTPLFRTISYECGPGTTPAA